MNGKKLNSGEFLQVMIEISRLMRPNVYVELGVRKGNTFKAIAPFAKKAIAVDKERGQIPELIRRNSLKNAHFYQLSTDDFSAAWAKTGEKIDLLFIDADHRKEQVLKDFDNFSPYVVEDKGLIILHDTLPCREELLRPEYCSNAWEAAWEIRSNAKYAGFEILTLPGNYVGLSMVRKSAKQLYWS